ncbi:RimK family alpha-L-glutamate ligase [Actinosynnema sp. NPDC020468]|uniref:RimK family alpha-L-glutamate ligase n=1 Tax=Actinosynnema sp. NPDC020468 TaxID=3154488 RepID=UPI00340EBFD2
MTGVSAPIAVLASRVRADEKRVLSELDRRGVGYEHVDTRALWGFLGHADGRIVLNREIGQVRAHYAASLFEQAGARVLNSARAIGTCGDKWHCSVALARAGVPTPETALALTPEGALEAFDAVGYPAVVKPLVGSWGRLVTAVPDREVAATVLEYVRALPNPQSHVVYVQRMIPKPDRDIRVIVVGDEPVGATYRRGEQWRTNVARGAVSEPCALTPEITALALGATRAVGADIAGVDLIEDVDGALTVLEVNHGVEFSGFQAALGDAVDVAARIVDHLVAEAAT